MDPILGMIIPWPINWVPSGWALCNGQLLSIQQNAALYSLLGTYFGGDGQTTFGLPDLRGRTILGCGQGTGLTNRPFADKSGIETTSLALSVNNLPSHNHTVPGQPAFDGDPSTPTPGPTAVPAKIKSGPTSYYNAYAATTNTTLLPPTSPTGNAGGGQPVSINNMQPYVAINYIIATMGIYPSRD